MKQTLITLGLALGLSIIANAQQSSATSVSVGLKAWGTNATTVDGTVAAQGTNAINGPGILGSLTIYNPNTVQAITVTLFDSPATNNALVKSGIYYTNVPFVMQTNAYTNLVKITTNFTGVKTTNTFTNAIVSGFWTNNVLTNAYRRIYTVAVPPNTTISPNLGTGLPFSFGVTITNSYNTNDALVTLTYDPSL